MGWDMDLYGQGRLEGCEEMRAGYDISILMGRGKYDGRQKVGHPQGNRYIVSFQPSELAPKPQMADFKTLVVSYCW